MLSMGGQKIDTRGRTGKLLITMLSRDSWLGQRNDDAFAV
jgi:hypothetical protein